MWICTWTGTKVCQHACGTQQGSGLLTVHLSPSNWIFSSGVIVFPAASSPLSLTRSPLSSCSPHLHIRNSDQHLIAPSLRLKHRSISETSTFSLLHLIHTLIAVLFPSLFSLPPVLIPQRFAFTATLLSSPSLLLPSPAIIDHTLYMAVLFYPISHTPACFCSSGGSQKTAVHTLL